MDEAAAALGSAPEMAVADDRAASGPGAKPGRTGWYALPSRWALPRAPRLALALTIGGTALGLSTCSPHLTTMDRVQALHVLRVASVNSPTTCYKTPTGESGYECDLLKGLARAEHLALHIQFFVSAADVERAVAFGQADLGAAALRIPAQPATGTVQFTSPIGTVAQQLVYRRGDRRPRDLGDLEAPLELASQGNATSLIPHLHEQNRDLHTQVVSDTGPEDLLFQVSQGGIPYTICDSTLVALNQRYYPQLDVAFDVVARQPIGWVIPDDGPGFFSVVEHYFDTAGTAQMEQAFDRYFSPRDETAYLGLLRFSTDVRARLPGFQVNFQHAARETGVDWQLLAAISYQESRWDPQAVSPTGVRGMMMLTSATAQYLDVSDRVNPRQSIGGGSRYFSEIMETLPPSIEGHDRLQMALAAYNLGVGHVLDVRKIVVRQGGNPDTWRDVSRALPLLMQERWYKQTESGYARGREALDFVSNVENYYDVLSWLTGGRAVTGAPKQPQVGAARAPAPRIKS